MSKFYTRSRNRFLIVLFTGLYCIISQSLLAQLPAFPGAEGAGMYTIGGRGTTASPTTVFEVTNLSDDGQTGSLRYALTASATYRTVVFRVSGTIHLNSKLTIKANTTIAGQTAPGDGICVADYPVVIGGDNVIVRYMRFRLGDKNQKKVDANGNPVDGSGGDDAFGGLGASNVIIDHCSVSWSSDEALTIYRGDNLTVQWCFVAEPLNYSYHWETGDTDYERHGYGGIWGAKRGSFHHNLIAHCRNRTPRFAGVSTYSPNTVGVENCDLRNNVIYNWGINNVYGGEGGNYNVINNYYKYGPNTSSGVRYRICNPSYSSSVTYGKWYVDGNYVDGSSTNTSNNWSGVVPQGGSSDLSSVQASSAFDLGYSVTTQTASEVYEVVLQGAGCSLPNRDTLDQRLANDVRNRTGQIIDVQGGYPHGTAYEQTVNAWPALNTTAALADTDHDGMPDNWETSNGLNPNDANDRSGIAANGYTNLENYLNSLTTGTGTTNPAIYISGTLNNFTQTTGSPSSSQTYTISGVNLTNDITITAPANYQVSPDGGTTWSSSLSLSPSGGSVAATTIAVRLNATTAGVYSGNIVHASAGASDVNVAVNGTTAANDVSGIGDYAEIDGGYEKQTVGSYTTVTSHTSTTNWEVSAAYGIVSSGARTGDKYLHYNQASSSNKYIFSPVLTSKPLLQNAPYVIQFWYRPSGTLSATTTLRGWSTVTGQTGGSNTTLTTETATLDATTEANKWVLFTGTITTPNLSPTSTYVGIRTSNPQSPFFDIDDYVLYEGSNIDNTAPDAPQNPSASTTQSNSLSVTWSAPAAGVDGGGYMVVRSTLNAAPSPNDKGVYITGNTIGTDYKVVYAGKNNSFSDAEVAAGTTYYYHIFTADKAFNYSAPVAVTGLLTAPGPSVSVTGNLNSFSQNVDTPSTSQSIAVSGNNLTANVTVTASAGYELSEDDNTWSSSLNIVPESGAVQSTVLVRLNANAAGSYNGTITVSSSGATDATLSVTGIASVVNPVPAGMDAVVAKDGSGNYTSVQAAINAAPTGRSTPYKIYIKKGKYVETVTIPGNKPFIQLIGESLAETIISYDNYSGKPNGSGGTYGTSTSGTIIINAADVMLMNLSAENATAYGVNANASPPAAGDGPQAVAVYTTSDRVVFYNCRFNGGQDTYYGGNVKGTRVYLKNCYIDGNTDFMFGSSTIIFDTCIIYPRTRLDGGTGGYVTAVNTKAESGYGYVYRDCKITKNRGTTLYTLGRPWQNDASTADASKSHNKVVFLNTSMGSSVKPEGWSAWDAGTNTSYITYAEYYSKDYNGNSVNVSNRVSWSQQLTAAEAAKYYNNDTVYVNADSPAMTTWNPYSVWPELSNSFTPELVVSNLIARKGASTATITWNISWPMPGITCDLYRSTDKSNWSLINSQQCTEDTAGNFSFVDNNPQAGQSYYYIVRSSKSGFANTTSDTATVSSVPTITVSGTLSSFLQGLGTPSKQQAYLVSGVNLLDSLKIIPPAGFEVSSDKSNWFTNTNPLAIAPANNTVANTTIYVRLNAGVVGTYIDSIYHTSPGAATVKLAVIGTVQSDPIKEGVVLEHWPLTTNANDSAAIRSAGVEGTVPSFNRFQLSDGVTVPAVTAYSSTFGQAFAATTDGFWATASGGPGGTLNRTHYEEFTVVAKTNYRLRLDTLLLNASFYGSSSNTRIAVVYSNTRFRSDSTEISVATRNGTAVTPATNGTFANAVTLNNITNGNTDQYSFVINGSSGINVNAGDTLTFRLYFSCGSTSAGRYAKIKDVIVKGEAIAATVPTVIVNGSLNPFSQNIGTPSATQTYTVSGSNLRGDIIITPPAGYEISADGSTWYSNSNPLNLTPSGGSLSSTTVTVRLNATSADNYSGNIVHVSNSADSQNMAVSGTATVPVPAITLSGTLNVFSQIIGAPSATQTYTVSGNNLTADVTITPPSGYEISADGGNNWYGSNPLSLTPSGGTLSNTTITVRLNATSAGSYSGSIVHASTGAASQNMTVSGTAALPTPVITVSGSLNAFSQTIGAPSATQTYTISGSNLTGDVTITPPAGYEISANGGSTWYNTNNLLSLTPSGGTLSSTTITVRLNATATGSYTGNIVHASSGAASQNIAVSGTTKELPSISISQNLVPFVHTIGTPSAVQTFRVSGANLTGNVTITPPLRYELSLNGGLSWTSSAISLAPSGGTVNPVTISVRLNGIVPGAYNGAITLATAGTSNATIPVSGFTKARLNEEYAVYPVPAYRTAYIVHPLMTEQTQMNIYSITGAKLFTKYIMPGAYETPIDVSGLSQGVYVIEINTPQKTVLRIIKQ